MPSTALGWNKKETKRKGSFKKAIVTTGEIWVSLLTKFAYGDLLKRPKYFSWIIGPGIAHN